VVAKLYTQPPALSSSLAKFKTATLPLTSLWFSKRFLAALNESKFTIFKSVLVKPGHVKLSSAGSCAGMKVDSRDAPAVSAVMGAERAMVSFAIFRLSTKDGAMTICSTKLALLHSH
jgi:hypothetical protein